MTEPTRDARTSDRPADALPDVDTVIHDARETSWQLPDAAPGPADTDAGPTSADVVEAAHEPVTATSAEVAYPAADAARPVSAPVRSSAATTAHGPPAHGAATAASHGAAATAQGGHGETDEEPLGPIDVELWGAGILGTLIGLFMAICFVLATAGTGAY